MLSLISVRLASTDEVAMIGATSAHPGSTTSTQQTLYAIPAMTQQPTVLWVVQQSSQSPCSGRIPRGSATLITLQGMVGAISLQPVRMQGVAFCTAGCCPVWLFDSEIQVAVTSHALLITGGQPFGSRLGFQDAEWHIAELWQTGT